MQKSGTVLGGTLIVAGTCIGAGSLGLPVLTGGAGFLPSVALYIVCWIVMACTGLLFLEICLWMEKGSNILSMAGRFLGPVGKGIVWFVYLYLFYSLTVAYVVGSGDVVTDLIEIPRWLGVMLFIAVFSPLVYVGPRAVDRTNLILVVGLGLTYAAFVGMGISEVQPMLLQRMDWGKLWVATPVILLSFGFQGVLPTLVDYLKRDPMRVRQTILMGTALPFIAYVVWEWLILGIVPQAGLEEALRLGQGAVMPLRAALESPVVFMIAEFFAFFALTSSFLGVTLGMRDFLADGLRIEKTPFGRLVICAIIFVPSFVISLTDPRLFLLALTYGGGIGGVLLLGVLPVVLVWIGRYRQGLASAYRMKGGRPALLAIAAFVVFTLVMAAI